MDFAPLIGSVAAFVAALAFLARALTPAIVAWIGEDTKTRAALRLDLERCHGDRAALERRIAVLEAAWSTHVK